MSEEERAIYREALEQHLAKSGRRGRDAQQMWVNVIESTLTDFIRRHYMGDISSIYQLSKVDLFNAAVQQLMLNEEMQAENEATEGKLLQAMRIYIAFLGSKWHPSRRKVRLGKGEKPAPKPTPKPAATPKPPVIKMVEGAVLQQRDREVHQRNPQLRRLCIEAYGSKYECVVCGMNFVQTYGEIGKEFIEVHHLYPISETDGEHEVDPANDMIPLCSNCHSMIHRLSDPADWQRLKEMFDSAHEHQ